ncbi:hypothetical protein HK101_009907 [Irineochytrium annulatum]|nr:hypothetical protein HK101_009907 [Irineochytrium annulatum]
MNSSVGVPPSGSGSASNIANAVVDVAGNVRARGRAAAMMRRRTVAFLASLLCMACAGTLYLFSSYAPELARKLGFTQVQKNLVASLGGFGLYLSAPVLGFLVDVYPPYLITLFGGLCLLAGYTSMALSYGEIFPTHHVFVGLGYALVGVGSAAVFNSSLSVNVRNFDPRDHGFAVGISVSFFGLSAFFFTLFGGVFGDTFDFLLFVGLFTGGGPILASVFLHDISGRGRAPKEDNDEGEDDRLPVHIEEEVDVSGIGGGATSGAHQRGVSTEASDEHRALLDGEQPEVARVPTGRVSVDPGFALFQSADAWILFGVMLLVTGPGLMYINNIGEVVLSLGGNQAAQRVHVSLISVNNCAGRIVNGLVSDWAGKRFGMTRIYGLIGGASLVYLAQVLIAWGIVGSLGWLWIVTSALGFGYGACFAAAPALVSQWFGLKHFGSNWGYNHLLYTQIEH